MKAAVVVISFDFLRHYLLYLVDKAVLGCTSELTLYYIEQVEPYLQEPSAFPKAQVMVENLSELIILAWLLTVIMAALRSRCGHYIFALCFLSIFLFFYSSPNLSRRRLGVYHTLTHGVALVRI